MESLDESEFRVAEEVSISANGFLRILGIGYCQAVAQLSQLQNRNFLSLFSNALGAHIFPSDLSTLRSTLSSLEEHLYTFEEILAAVMANADSLQAAFTFLLQDVCSELEDPIGGLNRLLRDEGDAECLKPLLRYLRIALDIKMTARSLTLKVTSPAVYVYIMVGNEKISWLLPRKSERAQQTRQTEMLLYANFDREFSHAIATFSKALGSVETAGVECILPHSELRTLILEAVKFNLELEVPRLILATKFKFRSSCRDCSQREEKEQMQCEHNWKCKECAMVAIYTHTQHRFSPETVNYWSFSSCCVLSAEQLQRLFSGEELQMLHLELVLSPAC